VNDAYVVNKNAAADPSVPVALGPNIKPFPVGKPLGEFTAEAVLLLGDNITTDDIMPSDASLLPYRSNIPHLADFAFSKIDPDFPARAKAAGASAIIAGGNYGQGSSREHAALAPLYLGVRLVLASSFARIHRSNLINSGILPLTFKDPADAAKISLGDKLRLAAPAASDLTSGKIIEIENLTKGITISAAAKFTEAEARILLAGGKIADIARASEYL
jgi:aconitate hydratase